MSAHPSLGSKDELSAEVDVELGDEPADRENRPSPNTKPEATPEQYLCTSLTAGELARIPTGRRVTCGDLSEAQQLGKLTWHLPEFHFDMTQLPDDMQRVKTYLQELHNEQYALRVVFVMQSAIHLHRAWNMTPLTNNIMRELKNKFNLRMTWELGTFKLKFRMQEGAYELHRHVPYDYDSEFQDKYYRVAAAVMRGSIDVQRALQYQVDVANYEHTPATGIFMRDNPCSGPKPGLVSGRIVLYPLVSATCAVIFFGGDHVDALVAAITGLVSGLIEWGMGHAGQDGRLTNDLMVGLATGLITGFVYHNMGESICISSVLLGTLYWFFYGTAFVIAIIEIIAGELQTGVVRFMAVSVKTFCLSMGAGLGLMLMCQGETHENWWKSASSECSNLDLGDYWWRIPLYLLCSAGVLGQYRFPVRYYWRALAVQLVGYEVQYQLIEYFDGMHDKDNMVLSHDSHIVLSHSALTRLSRSALGQDYAASNFLAAATSVVAAAILSRKFFYTPYYERILQKDKSCGCLGCCSACWKCLNKAGLTPTGYWVFEEMLPRLQQLADPNCPDVEAIQLTAQEEHALVGTIVTEENWNIWALLMPTVYQLVPGSMIAKLWFNALFPPTSDMADYDAQNNVSYNLMVIATSLALGLIFGLAFTRFIRRVYRCTKVCCGCKDTEPSGSWNDNSFYEDPDVDRTRTSSG